MQRFGHGDAGHRLSPARRPRPPENSRSTDRYTCAASGDAHVRPRRPRPPVWRSASRTLTPRWGALQRSNSALVESTVRHLQVVQQRQHLGGQAGTDRIRVQQVDRAGQAIALASAAFDVHTGGSKSLNTLPNGRPGLAQLTGQGVAGEATGSEFGQQLAVVHGSFHEVRKELCGKAASGARHAGFCGASNGAPGSG